MAAGAGGWRLAVFEQLGAGRPLAYIGAMHQQRVDQILEEAKIMSANSWTTWRWAPGSGSSWWTVLR